MLVIKENIPKRYFSQDASNAVNNHNVFFKEYKIHHNVCLYTSYQYKE